MRTWHDKNLQISTKIWALFFLVCKNVGISSFFGKLKRKCNYCVAYETFVCLANAHLSWKHLFKVFTSVGSICSLNRSGYITFTTSFYIDGKKEKDLNTVKRYSELKSKTKRSLSSPKIYLLLLLKYSHCKNFKKSISYGKQKERL